MISNLKQVRNKKGMTLRGLAEKSSVPMSNITKLEAGIGNPKLKTMCKLAKALDVEVWELFSCE